MPKIFHKIIECGCIVKATSCGIKHTDNGKMYLLCGHNYYSICNKCKSKDETNNDNNNDKLYDMWMNDNYTNDFQYAEWYLFYLKQND
jgi:hypothetical protein